MIILYITGHGVGGSNISLVNTIIGIKRLGICELVVVPDKETKELFISKGIRCKLIAFRPSIWPVCKIWSHYVSFPIRLLYQRVLNNIALFRLKGYVKELTPDIIHSNISVIDIGYKLSRKIGVPHIYHLREYGGLDFNYKRYPSQKHFYKILENSYSIAITQNLQKFYSLRDNRSVVIYNGIMPQRNYAPMKKEDYFLYVGGLSHEKGIDYLVDVFISLIKKGDYLKLYICGTGNKSFVDNLQSIVNNEGIEVSSRIVFLGQRDDVYDLMSKAIALVVPSLSEAFGRITAEAMFNDCLVIGNNTAGTKEQFDNGVKITGTEIGIRYSNAQELEEAIEKVYNTSLEHFKHMRERAFEVVNSLYTTEHNADEVYSLYQAILKK